MNLFSRIRECVFRALRMKKSLACLAVLFLAAFVLGLIFVKTPAVYEYHLDRCDEFMGDVVYSDRSVLLIFLERAAGNALLLAVISLAGVHPVACILPPVAIAFRGYTFGGSLYIFFAVYRFPGALLALTLYLPVHLATDAVLLLASLLAFSRAPHFCFGKRDFFCLIADAACLYVLVLVVCLAEMLLLLAVFHPVGNLI